MHLQEARVLAVAYSEAMRHGETRSNEARLEPLPKPRRLEGCASSIEAMAVEQPSTRAHSVPQRQEAAGKTDIKR